MIEKRLRTYLFPSIFAMIGISCYVLADTFFISIAAGADGITALNLALPVYAVMYAAGSMIGLGSATKYSLLKSAGTADSGEYFGNSIFWTLLLSIPPMLAGICMPQSILEWMGADAAILETGIPYLRTALLFAPAFMLNYTMTSFARNDNSPKIAMAATWISSAFNIVFDYILMFPMKLGMTGAALATGISPIVSMGVCMLHYLSKKNTIHFAKKLPSLQKLLAACSLGIAGFVGEISSGVTTLSFNYVLLKLGGNTGVAAYGIVANISLVGIAIFNGISQGLQPMASEAGGKGDRSAEHKIYRHSLQIGLAISALLVLVCWGFCSGIVSLFNSGNSAEMAAYAETGLKLYSTGFFIAAINIVRAGYFGAVGQAKACSVIALSRGIFAIIFFVILLPHFLGMNGVWLAFPAAELFTLIFSAAMERNRIVRQKRQCRNP